MIAKVINLPVITMQRSNNLIPLGLWETWMKALLSSLILSIKFPNFPMIMPAVLSGTKILTFSNKS